MQTITSMQNDLVKHWVKVRQNRDYRYDHGTFIVEGKKMVLEALSFLTPKALVVSDAALLPAQAASQLTYLVPHHLMEKISGLKSPEGILAEFPMPPPVPFSEKKRILVLDRVSDPGNLGALLRSALAFGWEGVFLLEDSCDPYNEKAIRASRGALFHLPFLQGTWKALKKMIEENQLTPIVADLNGKEPAHFKGAQKLILFLGHEGSGPSYETLKHCQKVHIPMKERMESLNVAVAGSILMYELRG